MLNLSSFQVTGISLIFKPRRTKKIFQREMSLSVLLVLVAFTSDTWAKITTFEQAVPTRTVSAVAGGSAALPCDYNSSSPEDRILLVLWYREGTETPIYSFDARKHPVKDGRHWSDPNVLGSRSYFRLGSHSAAQLIINEVRESDQGSFRCRIDFKMSPTRNSRVNLTVIVPPNRPVILDSHGLEVRSSVGPLMEGSSLSLTCETSGGRPLPRVTWWRENRLLDAVSEVAAEGRIRNTLRVNNLTRDDLGMTLTCQATNNNISMPEFATVTVDLKLAPLTVQMQGESRPLSADRKYEFTCSTAGGRPPALVTWWKGTTRLQSTRYSVSADGNATTSTLTYVPTSEDDAKLLTCRVEHELLVHQPLEDYRKLRVHYVPIVHLDFAGPSQRGSIKEGDDVYFECSVKALPWITKIMWRHNGKQLYSNATEGLIISNQTMVIQRVDRRWSGLFTCAAGNEEGDGESNALSLNIQFAPVCKGGQLSTFYAARGESIAIPCEVEAYPSDLVFHWTFNGTRDFADIPGSHYITDRLRSSLTYRPMTEKDYGTLMCWSRNLAGEQRIPCVFHVIAAGRPDPVSNCTETNQTTDSIHIHCSPGYDGGLPQQFVIETLDEVNGRIVGNRTSHVAFFTLRGLDSGRNYVVTIWGVNPKGRSDPYVIHVATQRVLEREKATEPVMASSNAVGPAPVSVAPPTPLPIQLTPVLGTLIGVGSALLLAALIIAVVMRVRGHAHRRRSQRRANGDKADIPLNPNSADESFDLKEKNSAITEDSRDEDEKAFDKILSMTTTRRLLAPASHNLHQPSDVSEVMYVELSLPPVPQQFQQQQAEPTVYAQIDHTLRNVHRQSLTSMGVANLASPPGYARLPPVDQYRLLPYAESSSPSPTPSQLRQTPDDQLRPMPELSLPYSGQNSRNLQQQQAPLVAAQGTSEVRRISPVGTTRL